jgi:hypothetical protein
MDGSTARPREGDTCTAHLNFCADSANEVIRNGCTSYKSVNLSCRTQGLRRKSIGHLTSEIRVFLRYLHENGETTRDLSVSVTSPILYAYEDIPSALLAEEVEKVLATTRRDRTLGGRRDYAILMLLARYGLRSGEIAALRVDDFDWKNEILLVRHSKPPAYVAGCDSPSQCGMACPSADRGLRPGRASTLLDPRPRGRVWHCLHPAHPGHGHSRPTGLGAVALAERIRGEADRLDPTGMS